MTADIPVTRFNRILARSPAGSVVSGLRAQDRGNPSLAGVQAEHAAYLEAMRAAGVTVRLLPALEAFPDSVFMEDPALVFSEGAIVLRPGAPSRLAEAEHLAPVLREMFDRVLDLPGTGFADGGDVLTTPRAVMIGLSARTDRAGAEALIEALARLGRKGQIVATPPGVLHFKTDCSLLDEETVLATPRLAASGVFEGVRVLLTAPGEDAAANALRVNDVVMLGSDFPRTRALIEAEGYRVVPLHTSEIGKIDAGLSCMSLRWYDPALA
jgi:dimethylargininase